MALHKTFRLLLALLLFCVTASSFAQSGNSCVATISPAGQAAFCPGGSVLLRANSGTNLAYQWYRDDVPLTGATALTYAASQAGSYKVRVSSKTTPAACVFSFSEPVVVTQSTVPAIPDFTFSPQTFECSGTPIEFEVDAPQADLTYTWEFGDGDTETGTSARHAFYSQAVAGQDFIVTLTASNETGCSNSRSKVVTVSAGPAIKLINQNNFRNCGGGIFKLTVFDESTVADPAGTTYKIDWGNTSFGQPATSTYSSPPAGVFHNYPVGIYTLKYSIISASGCSVTKNYNVYNISNPAVAATSAGNTTGCGPLTVTFPITGVSSNHASTTYVVDFGDGTPKQFYTHSNLPASINHTYTKSSCGSPGQPPGFAKDAFIFQIIATNSCGSTPAAVGGIRVYTQSQASFTINPEKACVGLPTKFINTTQEGRNAECNTNTTYYWNFGDGSPEIATPRLTTIPEHTYLQPGKYTVTLRAENNCTPTTFSKEIEVIYPPIAKFTAAILPTTACLNATVSTQNQSTGDQVAYQWSVIPNTGYTLAAGSSLTSATPAFQFNTAGTYRIRLQAYNPCKSDTTSQKITIKGLPGVSLPGPQTYCGPQSLTFDEVNEKHRPVYEANFGTIAAYRWEVTGGAVVYENGTTAASANPAMRLEAPGTYQVSVTVSNECGDSQTATQSIVINPIPETPVVADQTICIGSAATFNLPAGNLIYKWYASATDLEPIATAGNGATFTTGPLTTDQTYYVEAIGPEGCLSPRVPARVLVTPVITNNSISGAQVLCLGSTAAAITGSLPSGGGAITYMWESSTNGTLFTAATGTNNEQHYTPENLATTTWFRRKVISPACAPLTSDPVIIEIQQPITQNTISASQVICAGRIPTRLTGSVPAGGKGTYLYQWEWRTENGTYANAPGTSNTKDYTPAALSQTTYFRRKVSAGICAPGYSEEVKITVNPVPAAPAASPTTICANNTAVLTATAAAGTIQWYGVPTGGQVLATRTSGETFTTPVLTQTTTYYIQAVENNCPSARIPVTVTVKPAPVAQASQTKLEVCSGATTNIQLTSNLPGTIFRWTQTASAQVTGAANGTGNAIRQQLSNSGNTAATITYIVTPELGGCVGNPVLVEVTVNPDLYNNSIISSPQTICSGSLPIPLSASTPNGGSDQYTYLWEISVTSASAGFSTAPGANNQSDYAPGTLTQTTWFRRTVISGGCSSISPAVEITVIPPITQNTISADQVICSGSRPAPLLGLNPAGGTGDYDYIWEVSLDGQTFSQIDDAITRDYSPLPLFQPTWFRRKVTSGLCSETSTAIKIDIQQPITQNTIAGNQVICAGMAPETLSGSTPAGGNSNYAYQWQYSRDNQTFSNAPGISNSKEYTPGILNQTTYFRRQVSGGVCAPSFSEVVTITVNPQLSNNAVTSLAETICTGSAPKTITGSLPAGGDGTYEYLWEVSTTSANAGFTAAAGQNNQPGYESGVLTRTSWFRRKVSSGGCTHTSAAVQITVNDPIAQNNLTTGDLKVCAGSSTPTILGTNPTGGNGTYEYLWQHSTAGPGSGFTNAPGHNTQKEYTPGVLSQTTWFRRVVVSGPCEANTSASIKVEVNELIANNTITGAQTICAASQPAVLSGSIPSGGSGQYTYIWESSTISAASGFKTAAGNYEGQNYTPGVLHQTTWFRRKAVSAPCEPHISAVVEVSVTPAIVNNITTADQLICAGTRANTIIGQLPGGGTGQYQVLWESSIDNQVFGVAPGQATGPNYEPGLLHQTTWYRRKISSGACTTYSGVVKVTANPPITRNTIEGDQDLCMSSTPDILYGSVPAGGNGNYVYGWESSTDNQTFKAAQGINNTRDYQPGEILQTTWFRRKVMAGTCEPTYSEVVRISVTPGVSNNTIGVAQRICVGTAAAPIVGSAAVGGGGQISYRWEVSTTGSATGFTLAGGANDGRNYEPGYLTKTTWFRRIIISGGCSSISRAVQITVDTEVENNLITQAQTICTQTAPAVLSGSIPTGGNANYQYVWESSTDGIHFRAAAGDNDQQHYAPPVLTQSTWFRRVVLSAPCGASESNIILVTVVPVITGNQISQDQTICSGTAPATLTGQQPKGGNGTYTYLWEISVGNTFSPAPGINNQENYSPPVLSQTSIFRRTVLSAHCQQSASNSVRIQVNTIPAVPQAADAITCKGSTAILTASGAASNFAWYAAASGGEPLATGKTFETPAVQQETTFYVASLAGGCASDRVPVKVTLYNTDARASEDVTISQGQQTLLQASGGVSYTWYPATGLSASDVQNPWAKPMETTTYLVTVKSADGCIATDEVTVTVIPRIVVSNGITPNGDGANDTWVIRNIEFYPEAQVDIFNRWGNKVFSSKGYAKPWDGTFNGQPLPVAAYYYVIKLNNEEPPISGSITLVK